MWTPLFWKAAAERAVKTLAQTLIALLSVDGLDLLEVSWAGILSAVALATLLSVLSSIASVNVGEPGTPSLVEDPTPGRHAL